MCQDDANLLDQACPVKYSLSAITQTSLESYGARDTKAHLSPCGKRFTFPSTKVKYVQVQRREINRTLRR